MLNLSYNCFDKGNIRSSRLRIYIYWRRFRRSLQVNLSVAMITNFIYSYIHINQLRAYCENNHNRDLFIYISHPFFLCSTISHIRWSWKSVTFNTESEMNFIFTYYEMTFWCDAQTYTKYVRELNGLPLDFFGIPKLKSLIIIFVFKLLNTIPF